MRPTQVQLQPRGAVRPRPARRFRTPLTHRRLLALSLNVSLFLALFLPFPAARARDLQILNVSHDPTRELYKEINAAFAASWKTRTGSPVRVQQSHSGSAKQARSVLDGLPADVVTLALGYDIDAIASNGRLLAPDWQQRLPHQSAPYTSVIVFLVRGGNPRNLRDWDDLVRPGIAVITPNPRTSGGARWNYLAAWAWAERRFNGDLTAITNYMTRLFAQVPVLDTGARGAATTFIQREIGDVLISWENEAHLARREYGPSRFEIVVPSLTILAEPPVAWIDRNVRRHQTEEVSRAYLEFLYTPQGQEIIGRHFYRPRLPEIAARFDDRFPPVPFVTIDVPFGGWAQAHARHFREGGLFDQLYQNAR